MSKRNINLYLADISDSIDTIVEYTEGMTEKSFASDRKTFDAVIRNFEIIGEAANRIPDDVRKIDDSIPWRDIIDFRNRIAHEYFGVSAGMVWQSNRAGFRKQYGGEQLILLCEGPYFCFYGKIFIWEKIKKLITDI
ncbi:MAG: DUF86 domain-containing protein [Candidatus Goldiibacteriota bacterium]